MILAGLFLCCYLQLQVFMEKFCSFKVLTCLITSSVSYFKPSRKGAAAEPLAALLFLFTTRARTHIHTKIITHHVSDLPKVCAWCQERGFRVRCQKWQSRLYCLLADQLWEMFPISLKPVRWRWKQFGSLEIIFKLNKAINVTSVLA